MSIDDAQIVSTLVALEETFPFGLPRNLSVVAAATKGLRERSAAASKSAEAAVEAEALLAKVEAARVVIVVEKLPLPPSEKTLIDAAIVQGIKAKQSEVLIVSQDTFNRGEGLGQVGALICVSGGASGSRGASVPLAGGGEGLVTHSLSEVLVSRTRKKEFWEDLQRVWGHRLSPKAEELR